MERRYWEESPRRGAKGPARMGILLACAAVVVQLLVLDDRLWERRRHAPSAPVRDPIEDEMIAARQILIEKRDPGEAVEIGESTLVQRGPRADAYAVIGEGYLQMGKIAEAKRNLYLATVSPGADEDRLRARDLLESFFK